MVSITDTQWEKWGQPGGWTAWEPDTQADNFIPNIAVVVCKGIFHDAPDPQLQDKVRPFYDYRTSSGLHRTAAI